MRKDICLLPLLLLLCFFATAQHPLTASDNLNVLLDQPPTLLVENIPDCTPPKSPRLVSVERNFFKVEWDGVPAEPNAVAYIVRYRSAQKDKLWQEAIVTKGNSLEVFGVDTRQPCEVEVQKVCYWEDGSQIYSDWVPAGTAVAQKVTLPPHTCAQAYTYTTAPCWPALDSLAAVTTLSVGGFPIEVDAISHHFNGDIIEWTGTGIVPLPFGQDKAVRVEWNKVQINANRQICAGTVKGISDAPAYWPNLNPGPIPFGGEICVQSPSEPGFGPDGIHSVTGLPWDERGFGPDGKYVKQPPYAGYYSGAPYDSTHTYDPNGFNANGIHALTGTKYNPQGCDADGQDSLGRPCNQNIPPYSWMNPGQPDPKTQAGLEFAELIKDSLVVFIQQILHDMKTEFGVKIEQKRDSCTEIRDAMEGFLEDIGLQRTFVFGPDDVYFKEGMHMDFSAEPHRLALVGMDRNLNLTWLENLHVDLYHCDREEYIYVHFKEIILDLLAGGLTELRAEILAEIESLPEATIEKFKNNPAELEAWLEKRVRDAVDQEYTQQYGSTSLAEPNPAAPVLRAPSPAQPASNWLATGDLASATAHLLLAQALHTRVQDVAFDYLQGFREIQGIHRAYFMEAMVNARQLAAPFTTHDSLLMPIDITNRGSDGKKYTVYLDNIQFKSNQATLDAYILIELPFGGHTLVFEAHNVLFTPHGPMAVPIKIQLENDVNVRLNNSARLKLRGGASTYVAFDCKGFAGIGIAGDVELCREVVLPYNPATDSILQEPKRVSGHFQTYMPSFGEFYVEFSMDPFAIPGYEDVKWMIDKVALDMSETVSPPGLPPVGYLTPFAGPNGFRPMWKGFYVGSLVVRLPRQFSKKNTPIEVGIQRLVIDNQGVSGSVKVNNLLPLTDGNAGGWAFSIDSFDLTVLMNQFSRAKFNGLVHVPIFQGKGNTSNTLAPEDCFPYLAEISPGNTYRFAIQPLLDAYQVPIWKAGDVTLDPNSSIEMEYRQGAFKTLATLNGKVTIKGNLFAGVDIDVPPLVFNKVELSNQAPYFSPGNWDFPKALGAKFAGFEFSLSGLGMYKDSLGDPSLQFNALIKITDDTTSVKAAGGFWIAGRLLNDNGRQRWVYKDFGVHRIDITGRLPGVHVDGFAYFFKNNPVYGTGFRGGLGATFDKFGASIQVLGQFGRMPSGPKYFLVDALYCGKGIPIAPGLEMHGLGGGVYYHMNRPTNAFGLPACAGESVPIPTGIGKSLSGIEYTPDASKGIGFKLTVAVALQSEPRGFNANATFEMLFNSTGSLDKMWLYGNAQFMGDLNISALPTYHQGTPPTNNAAISANLNLAFTFGPSPVLDGQMQVYANVGGVLRGAGTNNKVVDASLRFAGQGDWYIKVGAPSAGQYAGMIFTIPGFGELAKSEAYFQIGTNVDGIPALPKDIAELTGGKILLKQERSKLLQSGNGFCLGTHLSLGSKNYQFLMFYAGLNLKLGLDVSLLNYGKAAVCEGQTSPVGINGWYANGRIYAGVFGTLGIRVKVFGSKRDFNIMTMAAAATMEAKLPNPFWARAAVGFNYNILGGLVKGNSSFDFEIGQQCRIVGDDPAKEVPLIYSVSPPKGSKGIPVSVVPIVQFNFPVGQSFSLDPTSANNIKYSLKLDSARLVWRNHDIPCTRKWDSDARLLRLEPDYFLPGRDSFTLRIKCHADSNGVAVDWEERIVGFRTGDGLTAISPDNVAGSYPLNGQYNFYKNELAEGRGYIQLKRAQPDLFIENTLFTKVVRFRKSGGSCTWVPLKLDATNLWEKKIAFDLPLTFLQNESIYEMQVLDFPKSDPNWGNALTGNAPCICTSCTTPPSGSPANSGGPVSPQAPTEVVLYTAHFRVSKYNRMMDKLLALENLQTPAFGKSGKGTQHTPDDVDNSNWEFKVNTNVEPFDFYEITNRMLDITTTHIQPDPDAFPVWGSGLPKSWSLAANSFPILGIGAYAFSQDEASHGISVISGASTSSMIGQLPYVTEQDYHAGQVANAPTGTQKLYFFAPTVYKKYHDYISQQVAEYIGKPSNQAAIRTQYGCPVNQNIFQCICENYYNSSGPYSVGFKQIAASCKPEDGNQSTVSYPIQFRYKLPGTTQVTTDYIINLYR